MCESCRALVERVLAGNPHFLVVERSFLLRVPFEKLRCKLACQSLPRGKSGVAFLQFTLFFLSPNPWVWGNACPSREERGLTGNP